MLELMHSLTALLAWRGWPASKYGPPPYFNLDHIPGKSGFTTLRLKQFSIGRSGKYITSTPSSFFSFETLCRNIRTWKLTAIARGNDTLCMRLRS